MDKADFGGYCRRIDVLDYRCRWQDLPSDVASLLELAEAIELEDKIIIDAEDYRE